MLLVTIQRLLRESTDPVAKSELSVSTYMERAGVLWKGKDWCQSDLLFEDSESGLFIGAPLPWCVFLGKSKERSSMMGEILNVPLIEIGEPKEQLHPFLVRWNRPFSNSSCYDSPTDILRSN
jgi:hypothetical protein